MTLEDIKNLPKRFLTPEDVSPYLECNPQSLRQQAQKKPSMLGFPVVVIGTRIKIPKSAFISFFGGRDGSEM